MSQATSRWKRSRRLDTSLRHLDQRIAYCRISVPDGQNAWLLWRAAAEAAVAVERPEQDCDAESCSCSLLLVALWSTGLLLRDLPV